MPIINRPVIYILPELFLIVILILNINFNYTYPVFVTFYEYIKILPGLQMHLCSKFRIQYIINSIDIKMGKYSISFVIKFLLEVFTS